MIIPDMPSILEKSNFIVRDKPRPVPVVAYNAEPVNCVGINPLWLGHIYGALASLEEPDAWTGTDEQIEWARQQIASIMDDLNEVCAMANVEYRQVDYVLEVSTDGGNTWTPVYDADTLAESIGNPPQFRQVGCVLEVSTDGGNTWTQVYDASECSEETKDNEVTPEPLESGGQLGNYCAGATYLADYFISAGEWTADKWNEQLGASQAFVSVVTAGIYDTLSATPLTGAIISMANAWLEYGINDYETTLSNPTFREELICNIYCAVKNNGGFNESAWTELLSHYEYGVPLYPITTSDNIDFLMDKIVGYTLATKKFNIGAMDTSSICESLCTECTTKWSRNTTHFASYHDVNVTPYVTLTGGIEWNGSIWAPVARPSDYEVIVDFTDCPEKFSVTEVQIAFTNMGYGTPRAKLYVWKDNGWALIDDRDGKTGAGGTIYTIMTFGRKFKFTHRWADPPYFGSTIQKLSSVTVRGYGTEPDMLPDVTGVQ